MPGTWVWREAKEWDYPIVPVTEDDIEHLPQTIHQYSLGFTNPDDALAASEQVNAHFGDVIHAYPNALRRSMDKVSERYQQAVASSRFVNALVSDTAYAADSIDARRLMRDVFDVAGSLQNHHAFDPMSLLDYFTPDERYQLWRAANIYWYTHSANAVANGGRMPYVERDLLAHMVATANS